MRRLVLLILTLLSATARAWIGTPYTPVPSLEYEIDRAQVIIRGTVKPIKPAGHFEIEIEETLKGEAPAFLRFTLEDKGHWPAVNGESQVLVCLTVKTSGAAANTASEEVRELIPNCSWRVGRLSSKVFRMDGTELKDAASLLAAARQLAALPDKSNPTPSVSLYGADLPEELRKRLGDDPTTGTSPFAKAAHALVVPKDQRLFDQARRWCAQDNWQYRMAGVSILSRYNPSDRSIIPLFQSLLNDPYFTISDSPEWTRRIEERAWRNFPVRSAAILALDALEMPQPADSELPLLRYQSVHWLTLAAPVALLLFLILLWRIKRLSFLGTLSILCTLIAASLFILSLRSRSYCDTWSVATAGANYEVTSQQGQVAFLRVQDDAPPHALMRRSYTTDSAAFWFTGYLEPAQQSAWTSFATATGQTVGAAAYDFRFAQLPHWSLIALFMLLPLYHLISRTRATLQRRARIQANRCPQCGYDLRAGHSRCPECGHF